MDSRAGLSRAKNLNYTEKDCHNAGGSDPNKAPYAHDGVGHSDSKRQYRQVQLPESDDLVAGEKVETQSRCQRPEQKHEGVPGVEALEAILWRLVQGVLVLVDGVDGDEARGSDDGGEGRPDGLDEEIPRQDEGGEDQVREEEGGDEWDAVELEVGEYDGQGNNSVW